MLEFLIVQDSLKNLFLTNFSTEIVFIRSGKTATEKDLLLYYLF